MTNIYAPSNKALAKLKSASKSKPATPLPPTSASFASRTRGSKRKTTSHLVPAAERRVSYLLKYLLAFLWLTLLTPPFLFFFSLSSRRTRQSPVQSYLMSPSLRYISFLLFLFFSSHVLPLPHVVNSPFGLHIHIYIPFYFIFFRRSPNLSPYIALLPRKSPPPWVYPWRAFLMGPMWHSQHLLPLLLHLRFLPKLPPLPPS